VVVGLDRVNLTLWLHGYTNFIGGRWRWKVSLLSALAIEPWSTELLSPVLFQFACATHIEHSCPKWNSKCFFFLTGPGEEEFLFLYS
jgi:hypothetical protein